MMDHLARMAVFQAVADAGSFRGAAKRLGISPSVVSHHVSQLEMQLELPLFYRSTRKLSLTDAGAELLRSTRLMTQAADEGMAAMQMRKAQPVGHIRVTLPSSAQHPAFGATWPQLLKRFPGLTFSITYTDAFSDLSGSQFDLAIRGGTSGPKDSAYKSRLFRRYEVWLTASPDYMTARSPAKAIDDLASWDWIEFPPGLRLNEFLVEPRPASQRIEPRIAITLDSMLVAEELALEGIGVLAVPRGVVEDHVREGRLVRLLPDVPLRPIETYVIWPANVGDASPVRRALDFLLENVPKSRN
ncbi:LysR family transcriptional regulator [Yoonia sp.]|uniref:LysR family transcriptional regulator n=1 Tax=Yoonia sp. TaxID=2212373 RepID=UPI003F6A9112